MLVDGEIEQIKKEVTTLEHLLDAAPGATELVYFKAGKNHPWHRTNTAMFDKNYKKRKRDWNDPDHAERNLRWLNNYRPSSYKPSPAWWQQLEWDNETENE